MKLFVEGGYDEVFWFDIEVLMVKSRNEVVEGVEGEEVVVEEENLLE